MLKSEITFSTLLLVKNFRKLNWNSRIKFLNIFIMNFNFDNK